VHLTNSEAELHRQTIGVHNHMDLAGKPATRPANVLPAVIGDAGTRLVHADDRCVDHLNRRIVSGAKPIHHPVPDASPPPTDEAIVAGRVGAIPIWQITPWRTGSQNPQDTIYDPPVVDTGNTAWLARQDRPNGIPFSVGEGVSDG
jgi:hypothetical protein